MDEYADNHAESISDISRIQDLLSTDLYTPPSAEPLLPVSNSSQLPQLDNMAVATEPLTPSNHLPLEPTGLTPGFGGTPGFFSAEFGAINPFEIDFHDATASPLRVETSAATPPSSHNYFLTPTSEFPRSAADLANSNALRRNYDPSLVPTPGPRLPGLAAFKPSALKESTTIQDMRLPPSPREKNSPPEALNPAFLGPAPATFQLPPSTGFGSATRGIHGEVTPPTDEARSPEEKDTTKSSKPATKSKTTNNKKRKLEDDIKVEQTGTPASAVDEEEPTANPSNANSDSKDNKDNQPDNKRKKFLERNRLAASKCRQKKKEWANNLEEQARFQAQENKLLRASVAQLRDECLYLKNFLLSTHSGCSCVGVKNYLMKEAQMSQQVAGIPITSLIHSGMDFAAAAAASAARGYPPAAVMSMHHPGMPLDDRRRSDSVASVVTMSDGRPHQGSMSPQQ